MEKRGRGRPRRVEESPASVRVTFRLTPVEAEALRAFADQNRAGVSEVVIAALDRSVPGFKSVT